MDATTRRQNLLMRLPQGPVIIADGGMGTQLFHHGAPHDAVFEYLNLIDADLVSERNAEFLHNEVPGIQIPENVRRSMRGKSGEPGVAAGMAIAKGLIQRASTLGFGGYYLIPPFGKVALATDLIEAIRQPTAAV